MAQNNKANTLHQDVAYAYWHEICDTKPLPLEEQNRLLELAKAGDISARDAVVESFLRLVVSRAKHYCRDFDSFSDLIQEGNIGLMVAVERFDPTKGCQFSTYAIKWIDRYIRRESCRTGRPIRLPDNMVQFINQLLLIEKSFIQENGYEPSVETLAGMMNVSIDKILQAKESLSPILSLEQESDRSSSDSKPLIERTADNNSLSAEEVIISKENKKLLLSLMESTLSDVELTVLKLRFGFNENNEIDTLKSIADKYGFSKEGVRKIEARAIGKLHNEIMKRGLTRVDFV